MSVKTLTRPPRFHVATNALGLTPRLGEPRPVYYNKPRRAACKTERHNAGWRGT